MTISLPNQTLSSMLMSRSALMPKVTRRSGPYSLRKLTQRCMEATPTLTVVSLMRPWLIWPMVPLTDLTLRIKISRLWCAQEKCGTSLYSGQAESISWQLALPKEVTETYLPTGLCKDMHTAFWMFLKSKGTNLSSWGTLGEMKTNGRERGATNLESGLRGVAVQFMTECNKEVLSRLISERTMASSGCRFKTSSRISSSCFSAKLLRKITLKSLTDQNGAERNEQLEAAWTTTLLKTILSWKWLLMEMDL
jgi:hypothetical protein